MFVSRTKEEITLEALPTKEGMQVAVMLFRPDDRRILGLKDGAAARELFEVGGRRVTKKRRTDVVVKTAPPRLGAAFCVTFPAVLRSRSAKLAVSNLPLLPAFLLRGIFFRMPLLARRNYSLSSPT